MDINPNQISIISKINYPRGIQIGIENENWWFTKFKAKFESSVPDSCLMIQLASWQLIKHWQWIGWFSEWAGIMIKYKYWSNIYKLWQQVSHDELVMIQAYSWIAVRGYR